MICAARGRPVAEAGVMILSQQVGLPLSDASGSNRRAQVACLHASLGVEYGISRSEFLWLRLDGSGHKGAKVQAIEFGVPPWESNLL